MVNVEDGVTPRPASCLERATYSSAVTCANRLLEATGDAYRRNDPVAALTSLDALRALRAAVDEPPMVPVSDSIFEILEPIVGYDEMTGIFVRALTQTHAVLARNGEHETARDLRAELGSLDDERAAMRDASLASCLGHVHEAALRAHHWESARRVRSRLAEMSRRSRGRLTATRTYVYSLFDALEVAVRLGQSTEEARLWRALEEARADPMAEPLIGRDRYKLDRLRRGGLRTGN